jgi:hypothetical protein
MTQDGEKKMDDLIEEGDNLYKAYKKTVWDEGEDEPDAEEEVVPA